jgi:hypothetical protein
MRHRWHRTWFATSHRGRACECALWSSGSAYFQCNGSSPKHNGRRAGNAGPVTHARPGSARPRRGHEAQARSLFGSRRGDVSLGQRARLPKVGPAPIISGVLRVFHAVSVASRVGPDGAPVFVALLAGSRGSSPWEDRASRAKGGPRHGLRIPWQIRWNRRAILFEHGVPCVTGAGKLTSGSGPTA